MVFLVKYECKKMKSEEKVGGMQASEEKATLLFQKHNPQKSPPATLSNSEDIGTTATWRYS
jgi:hypothetical protein